jgi:hypothetical protein
MSFSLIIWNLPSLFFQNINGADVAFMMHHFKDIIPVKLMLQIKSSGGKGWIVAKERWW